MLIMPGLPWFPSSLALASLLGSAKQLEIAFFITRIAGLAISRTHFRWMVGTTIRTIAFGIRFTLALGPVLKSLPFVRTIAFLSYGFHLSI